MSSAGAERFDAVMRDIESLGYGTAEYHEALWFLLSVMARRQAVIAERIRENQRRRERAAATRAAKRAQRRPSPERYEPLPDPVVPTNG